MRGLELTFDEPEKDNSLERRTWDDIVSGEREVVVFGKVYFISKVVFAVYKTATTEKTRCTIYADKVGDAN